MKENKKLSNFKCINVKTFLGYRFLISFVLFFNFVNYISNQTNDHTKKHMTILRLNQEKVDKKSRCLHFNLAPFI